MWLEFFIKILLELLSLLVIKKILSKIKLEISKYIEKDQIVLKAEEVIATYFSSKAFQLPLDVIPTASLCSSAFENLQGVEDTEHNTIKFSTS